MVDVAYKIFPGPPGSVVEAVTVTGVVVFDVNIMVELPLSKRIPETVGTGLAVVMISGYVLYVYSGVVLANMI